MTAFSDNTYRQLIPLTSAELFAWATTPQRVAYIHAVESTYVPLLWEARDNLAQYITDHHDAMSVSIDLTSPHVASMAVNTAFDAQADACIAAMTVDYSRARRDHALPDDEHVSDQAQPVKASTHTDADSHMRYFSYACFDPEHPVFAAAAALNEAKAALKQHLYYGLNETKLIDAFGSVPYPVRAGAFYHAAHFTQYRLAIRAVLVAPRSPKRLSFALQDKQNTQSLTHEQVLQMTPDDQRHTVREYLERVSIQPKFKGFQRLSVHNDVPTITVVHANGEVQHMHQTTTLLVPCPASHPLAITPPKLGPRIAPDEPVTRQHNNQQVVREPIPHTRFFAVFHRE